MRSPRLPGCPQPVDWASLLILTGEEILVTQRGNPTDQETAEAMSKLAEAFRAGTKAETGLQMGWAPADAEALNPLCDAFGAVALSGSWTRSSRWPALVSDRSSQLGERCGDPVVTRYIDGEFVVAAADVLHEGVPGDDHLRSTIGL
jgi:hypothetical protein